MKIEYAPAETSSANRASSNGGGDDGRVGGGKLLSFREVFELMKNIDPASLPLSHDQKQHRDDSPAGRNSAATETVPQSLEFGLLLHSAFRDSQYIPYTAFYAESPPLNHTSLLSPFEMVFIDAPALRGITADSSPFRSFLHAIQPSESNKVAVFPNLGSNALLIAPAYNNHPDFRTNAAGAAGEGYFKLLRTIHLQQPALESMSGDDDSNGDGGDDGDDGGDDDVSRVNDRVTGGAHREGYYKKTDPNRYAHYASFIRQAPLKQVWTHYISCLPPFILRRSSRLLYFAQSRRSSSRSIPP